jgi:hypothetical protein
MPSKTTRRKRSELSGGEDWLRGSAFIGVAELRQDRMKYTDEQFRVI